MLPQFMRWFLNNKLLVFFGLASFCFFVSTVALVSKNNALKRSIVVIKQSHAPNPNADSNRYRLPEYIKPTNYALKLNPNLSKKVFEGDVSIALNISRPTKQISLHAKNLDIHLIEVRNNNQSIPVESTTVMTISEVLRVNLRREIEANSNVQLHLKFSGRLDQAIVGFYASIMRSGDTMVASKFQPTYARQAFPCFDEPAFKATYDITLVKPVNYVALSNMNELSRTLDPNMNTESVTFATSVPMSTYLACFVICNFEAKENEIMANGIGKNFVLRSFAQKDQTHKIDFAQDIGKRATEFYIKYYEVPFPLPKLDMIAIPDYVSGATEHWGLITYRETSFLIDDNTASSKNKISVANTVAHELAHMWFGNLVTMKWWDEVWLNEGFASYMQVKSLNALEPSWTMLDQFLTRTLHSVLVTDAKLSSHPIVQTVDTPDQITAIFDSISYNKGASVLRMLEGFIGEENFRRGVSDYLKKYEYGNTVTQDLLSSMEPYFKKDYPDLSLSYIMDTWTRQMGYPLVSVKPGDQANTYIVTQKRFLINPEAVDNQTSEFRYRWYIPITYKTNKGQKDRIIWFPNNQESVTINLGEGETWLKINNNQVGYYRVDYTADMWLNLIQQLKNHSEQLTISDRAHLLNDIFALAESKVVPYAVAMDLSAYLDGEADFVPWQTAASIFAALSDRLVNTSAHDDLEKYVQNLVKPLYEKQAWEKTSLSVIEGLLRTRVLSLATKYRLPAAEEKVRDLFLSWLDTRSSGTAIEPDLRDFVYYYGAKSATHDEWDKLWQIYLTEEDVQEQSKIRSALAAPRNVNILKRYLELAWDESNIRSQDYLNVLSAISSNPSGAELVWGFVRRNWPRLVERFTLNSRYLGNLIPSVTDTFRTDQQLKEMQEFFAQYPEAGAGASARERALETVRNNVDWANTHQHVVANWLQEAARKL